MNKDEVYERAKAIFIERYGAEKLFIGGCVYWSFCAAEALREAGVKESILVVAGTMGWPIVDLEDDDGISPTHFGYVWEPRHPNSLRSLIEGVIPEMHVWLALKESQELVDFSTGGFKECSKQYSLHWRVPDPPKYLWTKQLPEGVVYTANREATLFITQRLIKLMRLQTI